MMATDLQLFTFFLQQTDDGFFLQQQQLFSKEYWCSPNINPLLRLRNKVQVLGSRDKDLEFRV